MCSYWLYKDSKVVSVLSLMPSVLQFFYTSVVSDQYWVLTGLQSPDIPIRVKTEKSRGTLLPLRYESLMLAYIYRWFQRFINLSTIFVVWYLLAGYLVIFNTVFIFYFLKNHCHYKE